MNNHSKFNYNFHDILKIESDVDLGTPFFEVDDIEPDLIVNVVNDFKVGELNNMVRLGNTFFGQYNKDYIYYSTSLLKQKFKLYLKNIQKKETLVICNRNYYRYIRLPLVFSIPFTTLVWKIAWVKALQKGFTFQHSACIASGQDSILILGFSNTGKTRTTFSCLVRDNNLKYLADDVILLDGKGQAYSNFTRISARVLKSIGLRVPLKNKVGIVLEDIMLSPFSYFVGPLKIAAYNVENIFGRSRIQESAKVRAILFLERGEDKIEELDKDEAIRKMLLQTREGLAPHFSQLNILIYYSYLNPDFKLYRLEKDERKIITKVVENSHPFIIRSKNGDFIDPTMRIIHRI